MGQPLCILIVYHVDVFLFKSVRHSSRSAGLRLWGSCDHHYWERTSWDLSHSGSATLSNLLRFFRTLSLEYIFLCLLYTQQILLFNWMVYPITSWVFLIFFCEMYLHMVLLACFFLPFRERHYFAFPLKRWL